MISDSKPLSAFNWFISQGNARTRYIEMQKRKRFYQIHVRLFGWNFQLFDLVVGDVEVGEGTPKNLIWQRRYLVV